MKFYLLIFACLFLSVSSFAQDSIPSSADTSTSRPNPIRPRRVVTDTTLSNDSLIINDSVKNVADTVIVKAAVTKTPDTSYNKLLRNPYLPSTKNPLYLIIAQRQQPSKDELFYLTAALLLFLAFVKLVFPKYFQNIFRLFFQPSFRQKQTRDQLLQNNLPSLLFNFFFIFAAGIYIALLLQYFKLNPTNFFLLCIYAAAALSVLYTSKYVFLTFSGWVFNVKEAADTYAFVVFLINKIIGILLIPFILILSFSSQQITDVAITVSVLLLSALFVYRYLISFAPVNKEIKVSPFHFLLYIGAFEIAPLLFIYKLLALYMHQSL